MYCPPFFVKSHATDGTSEATVKNAKNIHAPKNEKITPENLRQGSFDFLQCTLENNITWFSYQMIYNWYQHYLEGLADSMGGEGHSLPF